MPLLLAVLAGCGARTGIGVDTPDAGPGSDARVRPRDATGSRDALAPPDAVEPLACDGRPLPRAAGTRTHEIPPRMQGLGVHIPDPAGIMIVGALSSSGVYAEQMVFLDLGSGVAQEIPVVGDAVDLPIDSGVAVHVSRGDTVVVVGGLIHTGDPTDQVFTFRGEGDPSGLRRVRAMRLPPFPLGPVFSHAGIYDPVGHRVIVHGGRSRTDDPVALRTTWALNLDFDPSPRWVELVAPDASPPRGTRAMGYDPVRHRAIEITDDEEGEGVAVYALDLTRGREAWTLLGAIDFAPSTRGELHYDPRACGFHLLSARRTRCVLEHWVLTVDGPGPVTVFRGEPEIDPAHFLASSTFVASRDELVVYAGQLCERSGFPNPLAHAIALVR